MLIYNAIKQRYPEIQIVINARRGGTAISPSIFSTSTPRPSPWAPSTRPNGSTAKIPHTKTRTKLSSTHPAQECTNLRSAA